MSELGQKESQLLSLLIDVEGELRRLGWWEASPPPLEALQSVQPFCIDTLSFCQWLQFVFIGRLRVMVESGMPLPDSCSTVPMAEESLGSGASELIALLAEVDLLLTAG